MIPTTVLDIPEMMCRSCQLMARITMMCSHDLSHSHKIMFKNHIQNCIHINTVYYTGKGKKPCRPCTTVPLPCNYRVGSTVQVPCLTFNTVLNSTYVLSSVYTHPGTPLSYYLPLPSTKMDFALTWITMPAVLLPCITVHYRDLPCTQQCRTVHRRA